MRHKTMIKSALATAAMAGLLFLPRLTQAQTTTPVPGNPVGTPFISPATSLVPDANTISPTVTGTTFANGFTPFFGNPFTFNPFFANPFFTGFGAPLISTNPIPGPINPVNFAAAPPTTGGPLLGINTPPHTAGGGPVPPVHTAAAIVAPLPLNTGGGAPASTAGAAAAAPGPVTVTNSAPPAVTVLMGPTQPVHVAAPTTTTTPVALRNQSTRIALRMQQTMRTQAMIPGSIIRVDPDGALVNIQRNGQPVAREYALTDVYFHRGNTLLDAATAPDELNPGDPVTVPEKGGAVF